MKIKPEHLAAAPAQAISQPGGFDAGDMASAAAQGYRDGWAAAQAATGPTWAALNHAWHKIGCDAAGMDWGAFTNAAHYAPSPQADSVQEDAARHGRLLCICTGGTPPLTQHGLYKRSNHD